MARKREFSLVVSPYIFKIVFDSARLAIRDRDNADEPANGETIFEDELIIVRDDLSHNVERAVVLHEITHVINFVSGVRPIIKDLTDEETLVSLTSDIWLIFIRENDEIIAYLKEQV